MAENKLDLSHGVHVSLSVLTNPGTADKSAGLRIEVYPLPHDESLLRTLGGEASQHIRTVLSRLSGEEIVSVRMPTRADQ